MSAQPGNALQGAIHKLAYREPLTAEDAEAAFDVVMQGQASAVQVAALLSAPTIPTDSSIRVVPGEARSPPSTFRLRRRSLPRVPAFASPSTVIDRSLRAAEAPTSSKR